MQVRTYPIRPLSLHQRTHDYDSTRPQNVLTITGTFSVVRGHARAPTHTPIRPGRSTPVAVVLLCRTARTCARRTRSVHVSIDVHRLTNAMHVWVSARWRVCASHTCSAGRMTFTSDNLSTIAIVRDVLAKETTKKKSKVDMNTGEARARAHQCSRGQRRQCRAHTATVASKTRISTQLGQTCTHC
jgi:Bardet-Biedl syndrome 7 protein